MTAGYRGGRRGVPEAPWLTLTGHTSSTRLDVDDALCTHFTSCSVVWRDASQLTGAPRAFPPFLQTIIRKFAEVIDKSPEAKDALGKSAAVSVLLKVIEKHSAYASQPQLGPEYILTTLGCAPWADSQSARQAPFRGQGRKR